MKKLFLLAIISAMIVTSAAAQESKAQGPAKQNQAEWAKKMKTDLNLTAEQSVKFDEISATYNTKIETLMKDESLDKETQKEKKMTLKKEMKEKLMEILTPDQQTKYKEIMDKKKAEAAKATN
jgi:Spy/CpxP family protein refolding chaperone